MQCVGALMVNISDGPATEEHTGTVAKDVPASDVSEALDDHLAKVIQVLLKHIPSMLPLLREEMLQRTSSCLHNSVGLERMTGINM